VRQTQFSSDPNECCCASVSAARPARPICPMLNPWDGLPGAALLRASGTSRPRSMPSATRRAAATPCTPKELSPRIGSEHGSQRRARARAGLHSGRRQPIAVRPQAMLEAKDLPRCDLSDFIERRLALAVGRDMHERARLARLPVEQARPSALVLFLFLTFSPLSSRRWIRRAVRPCSLLLYLSLFSLSDHLPAAVAQVTEVTGLTVRVINNVRKRMEVKPKFYDTFKGEGFPAEFSYNQKARGSDPNPSLLAPPPARRGQSRTSVHEAAAAGSPGRPSARRCWRPCAATKLTCCDASLRRFGVPSVDVVEVLLRVS